MFLDNDPAVAPFLVAVGHSFAVLFPSVNYFRKTKPKNPTNYKCAYTSCCSLIQELGFVMPWSQRFSAGGKLHLVNCEDSFPGNTQPGSFPEELAARSAGGWGWERPAALKAPAPPSTGPERVAPEAGRPPRKLGKSPQRISQSLPAERNSVQPGPSGGERILGPS